MGTVPEQVRRQAEQANKFFDQAAAPTDMPEVDPTEAPQTQQPEALNPEPAATEQPPAQPEAPPAQDPQAPEPAPAPAKTEDFEQKYRTLQGLFNAERRDRQTEKQTFEERIRALEARAEPPKEPAPAKESRVTDKDIETYGPELVDLIGRKAAEMADEIVEQRLAALKPELDKTREQVTSVAGRVYQNDQERFYGELARAVPDWQDVNVDNRWLSWLGETDPVFGVPRQIALDNASNKLDHARVAVLFNAFKEFAGLNQKADPAPGETTPNRPTLSPTPRTVGNATPPTPREPDTSVSRTEIAAHYRRASKDAAYRSSKEHLTMEGRIATAMATGKIIEA